MNLPDNTTREIEATDRPEQIAAREHTMVANVLHTIVLVAIILAFSFYGSNRQSHVSTAHGRIGLYTGTIIWEWLMVGYIVLGIRRRGVRLADLIRGRWSNPGEFFVDVGIAIGFWLVALTVLAAIGMLLGLGNANAAAEAKAKLGFMVPRTLGELALFIGVSATAGFCEEVIFRGYLQRQFTAITTSAAAGLVLQAIIFGAGHGYQGGARMLIIAVYGAMFGALALARKSLRPGMIAHGIHDSVEGVALYAFKFLEKVK